MYKKHENVTVSPAAKPLLTVLLDRAKVVLVDEECL